MIAGIIRVLGYERVYLQLCKVADTPFHIQGMTWLCKHVYALARQILSAEPNPGFTLIIEDLQYPFLCKMTRL